MSRAQKWFDNMREKVRGRHAVEQQSRTGTHTQIVSCACGMGLSHKSVGDAFKLVLQVECGVVPVQNARDHAETLEASDLPAESKRRGGDDHVGRWATSRACRPHAVLKPKRATRVVEQAHVLRIVHV
eukprot:scaffold19168_cov107-Isochrysis_galbana.AAC.7